MRSWKPIFLLVAFTFVTVMSIGSLIMLLVWNDQEALHSEEEDSEVVSQQSENSDQDYWTKERMENAEPVPMPTENKQNYIKEILITLLPYSIILFIIFAFSIILMQFLQIKNLQAQNEKICKELNAIKNMNSSR